MYWVITWISCHYMFLGYGKKNFFLQTENSIIKGYLKNVHKKIFKNCFYLNESIVVPILKIKKILSFRKKGLY